MRSVTPSERIRRVVVVVPAHDEQDTVVDMMSAVDRAARSCPVPVNAVLVLDSCSDGTRSRANIAVASARAVSWSLIETTHRRASSARQCGLDHLTAHLVREEPWSDIAVLSTDADTQVPTDWIARHTRLLSDGCDAVAGVVELTSDAESDLDHERWSAEYTSRFAVDGSHPHVHCANLSVRLDLLDAAGGFGHARRAEDIDLWERLRLLTPARLRSVQASTVSTSQRGDGRVVGGFATALEQFRTADLRARPVLATSPSVPGVLTKGVCERREPVRVER